MILLLVGLNFVISWFNAWACGKTWAESRHAGGFTHFMNWMGAIMSASGFTWCYLVVLVVVGSLIPTTDKVTHTTASLISPDMLKATFELGYMVIIGPVIGSGIALTLNSWAHFYRRRTLGSGAVAGWNTFAQVYNVYQAASAIPDILSDLGGFFGGSKSSSSSDNKNKAMLIVILLVVCAVCGGILTTRAIIMATARRHAVDMRLNYETRSAA